MCRRRTVVKTTCPCNSFEKLLLSRFLGGNPIGIKNPVQLLLLIRTPRLATRLWFGSTKLTMQMHQQTTMLWMRFWKCNESISNFNFECCLAIAVTSLSFFHLKKVLSYSLISTHYPYTLDFVSSSS